MSKYLLGNKVGRLHSVQPDVGCHVGNLQRAVHQPGVGLVVVFIAHLGRQLVPPHRCHEVLPREKAVDCHPCGVLDLHNPYAQDVIHHDKFTGDAIDLGGQVLPGCGPLTRTPCICHSCHQSFIVKILDKSVITVLPSPQSSQVSVTKAWRSVPLKINLW